MKTLFTIALLSLCLCGAGHAQSEHAVPSPAPVEASGIRLAMAKLCTACDVLYAQADQAVPATQAATSLGLRQLLQMAVETHPTVASARSEQQSAQSMIEAARMQFLPAPAVQTDSLSGRSATTFRLTQPLWTGGRLTADLRLSEVRELRARESISDTQITLATRVAGIAQSYLLNVGRRIAQQRNVDTLNDLLRMIERRSQAEVSATADVNMVRTRLAQAQADLESFRALENSALAQLSSAIGRPLEPGALELPAPPPRPPMLARLLERAVQDNPHLRLAEIDTRLAAIEIDRTRAAMWPTFSLRLERQVGEYLGSAAPGNRVFVSVQYAPGSGLSLSSQIEAAERHLSAVQRSAEASRRDVTERVEAEWRDLESSQRRLPELQRSREGAVEVLASNRRLFVSGRRSWIDLLNSVREIAQAEQAEVEARSVSVGSYYRLGLLLGIPMWSPESELP
ncbi:TolC family protein [Polaromonas sp. YR568]|uniref:TolC family protein n=1 Tax=Polaromonas sp. YR568 TaxID=1855301 RepID=UPI00398BC17F